MPSQKKGKILLIEDDKFLAEMYVLKFRQNDFQMEVAYDGKEGLDKVQSWNPDVILLDIRLPKMDGFELLKKLKNSEDLKEIPVILLTNLSQKEEVKTGLNLGAQAYLVKAYYTPQEVVDKVEEVVWEDKGRVE